MEIFYSIKLSLSIALVYNSGMKRQIELQGRQLQYELQRKKVKNINLRIKAEGVFVSANRLVPQYIIDGFLRDRAEFILSALERMEKMEKPEFCDGSRVSLLGGELVLRIFQAGRNGYKLKNDEIELFLKDEKDGTLARKTLDALFREKAEEIVPMLCEKLCKMMGKEMPEIKYRAMKSRWGSCTPKKNQICINTRLMTAPLECIEFVIAHELCHFLRADHSAEFYRELSKIMPDWKVKKQRLRFYGRYLQ